MKSMVHTTLGATPMQLVFGQDAIQNILHNTNWKLIKKRKQELACKNNTRKNRKCVARTYKSDNLVLVKNKQKTKYGKDTYQGPWTIKQVNNNGTVNIKEGLSETR